MKVSKGAMNSSFIASVLGQIQYITIQILCIEDLTCVFMFY